MHILLSFGFRFRRYSLYATIYETNAKQSWYTAWTLRFCQDSSLCLIFVRLHLTFSYYVLSHCPHAWPLKQTTPQTHFTELEFGSVAAHRYEFARVPFRSAAPLPIRVCLLTTRPAIRPCLRQRPCPFGSRSWCYLDSDTRARSRRCRTSPSPALSTHPC